MGTFSAAGDATGVVVSGGYAYVGDGSNGLVIVDISDKDDPGKAGSYDTEGVSNGVTVSGDYAYVADGANGLVIIDISSEDGNGNDLFDILVVFISVVVVFVGLLYSELKGTEENLGEQKPRKTKGKQPE